MRYVDSSLSQLSYRLRGSVSHLLKKSRNFAVAVPPPEPATGSHCVLMSYKSYW
jgi:hypothetical protein